MRGKTLLEVPIDSVECPPQSRILFDEEKIKLLAQSMTEVGLLQPILVRLTDNKPTIIDGECRLRAARLLGWETITALVEDDANTDPRVLQKQLIANCQRSDLTPTEKALAIRRLMKEAELSAAKVAEWLGLSAATVSKQLTLLLLSKEMQEAVHLGRVAASTAYEIAKVREPKKRSALEKQALEGTLTRDSAASASRTRSRRVSAGKRGRTVHRHMLVVELGESRSACLRAPNITTGSALVLARELVDRLQERLVQGVTAPASVLTSEHQEDA